MGAVLTNVTPSFDHISSLGAWGEQSCHEERDLHTWTKNIFENNLERYYLYADWTDPKTAKRIEFKIPVIIPFEMMHTLHNQGSQQFGISMLGERGAAGVAEFWREALKETWAQQHPAVAKHAPETLLPTTWHLDGAEVTSNTEFYFYSFGLLLVQQSCTSVLDSRYLCAAVPYVIMKLPGMKMTIVKLLAEFTTWCMKVLDSKRFPDAGFYNESWPKGSVRARRVGEAIIGDWVPVWIGCKADGKARQEMHDFKRWWKCVEMCDSCRATNPACRSGNRSLTYMDFSPEAPWTATAIDHDAYMEEECRPNGRLSPMASIPGFRKELVFRDLAHIDFLGFGRDLGGSLCKSFWYEGTLGEGSLDSQLAGIMTELNAERKLNGLPKLSGYLSASAVGMDNLYKFPELASYVKAKRVEILNKFLCRKAVKLAEQPGASELCKLRGTLAWAYNEYHRVLDEGDLFLTEAEVDQFSVAARLFLMSLQKLRNMDKRWMWNIRPKHHQLDHMVIDLRTHCRLNPKKIMCLLEEDFLGTMKQICKYCRGLDPVRMMDRIFDRYLLNLNLRWERRKRLGTFKVPHR